MTIAGDPEKFTPEVAPDQPTPQTETVPVKQERPAWLRFLIELLETLAIAAVLYFLIDSVVARVRVENISMEPTLQPGEFILVNRLAYRLGEVHRGDIVIFHYPANPNEDYIKRIIGIPGDTVEVRGGRVYVNDQEVSEDYIAQAPFYTGKWIVPEASLFVLGDNRNSSSDSHAWGFVPYKNLVGRALVVYWPFDQAKILNHPFIVNAAN